MTCQKGAVHKSLADDRYRQPALYVATVAAHEYAKHAGPVERCNHHPCDLPEIKATALEVRADSLVRYGNSLPDGVTTEAFAEAANLRREARSLRG